MAAEDQSVPASYVHGTASLITSRALHETTETIGPEAVGPWPWARSSIWPKIYLALALSFWPLALALALVPAPVRWAQGTRNRPLASFCGESELSAPDPGPWAPEPLGPRSSVSADSRAWARPLSLASWTSGRRAVSSPYPSLAAG